MAGQFVALVVSVARRGRLSLDSERGMGADADPPPGMEHGVQRYRRDAAAALRLDVDRGVLRNDQFYLMAPFRQSSAWSIVLRRQRQEPPFQAVKRRFSHATRSRGCRNGLRRPRTAAEWLHPTCRAVGIGDPGSQMLASAPSKIVVSEESPVDAMSLSSAEPGGARSDSEQWARIADRSLGHRDRAPHGTFVSWM